MAHIRERRPGVWQVIFYITPDPVTGRPRQRSRQIKGTRRDAEAEAARIDEELESGAWADDSKMRVGPFIELWLQARRTQVRPSTLAGYGQKLAHVDKHMGHRRLSAISGGSLSALYGRLLEEGLSAQSVMHVHRVTHKMLADAVRWGYLKANPAAAADPPSPRRHEEPVWTAVQAQTFLKTATKHRWAAAWVLALTTGMRRGEICGLRWDQVDLDDGVIHVRQVRTVADGRVVEGPPKTSSGRRVVTIDQGTVDVLKAERRRQLERRMKLGVDYDDGGWIVCWEDGRPPHPDRLTKAWARLCKTAKVPRISLHDARHTSATLMLAAGVPAKVVSERLGHAGVGITLDRYTHRVDELHRDAADKVGRMLGLGQ